MEERECILFTQLAVIQVWIFYVYYTNQSLPHLLTVFVLLLKLMHFLFTLKEPPVHSLHLLEVVW